MQGGSRASSVAGSQAGSRAGSTASTTAVMMGRLERLEAEVLLERERRQAAEAEMKEMLIKTGVNVA